MQLAGAEVVRRTEICTQFAQNCLINVLCTAREGEAIRTRRAVDVDPPVTARARAASAAATPGAPTKNTNRAATVRERKHPSHPAPMPLDA